MTSLVEFQSSGMRYNPSYLNELTIKTIVEAKAVPAVSVSKVAPLALDAGIEKHKDAAFEQAWIWMKADPAIATAIANSGLTKEQLSTEVNRKLNEPADKSTQEAAAKLARRRTHERVEENGTVVHKISGVPVLEYATTSKVGANANKIMLLVAVVLDLLALVFAAFSIYAQYNVAAVQNKVAELAPPMVGKVGPQLEKAAELVRDLIPQIERGQSLDKACTAVYMVASELSGLLNTAAQTALQTMSWTDWAIGIGSILAGIAAILLSEGLALVAKVGECIISLLAVLQDIIAFASA